MHTIVLILKDDLDACCMVLTIPSSQKVINQECKSLTVSFICFAVLDAFAQ